MAIRRFTGSAQGGLLATAAAGVLAIALLVLGASPARADCAVGDAACINVDTTSGDPGTLVTMQPFGPGCNPGGDNHLAFVAGEYDPNASYPTVDLDVTFVGEARKAMFRVPSIEPGEYNLSLSCDADLAIDQESPGQFLGFTFTVLPATDTATAVTSDLSGVVGILLGIWIAVFLAVLAGDRPWNAGRSSRRLKGPNRL